MESEEVTSVARWEAFSQCAGCGFDFSTGEGERSCSWGECPYLPLELDVFCPNCRYNFLTGQGNPPCDNPATCEHGAEARTHIENLQKWAAAHPK
jgi:hypothetical protein